MDELIGRAWAYMDGAKLDEKVKVIIKIARDLKQRRKYFLHEYAKEIDNIDYFLKTFYVEDRWRQEIFVLFMSRQKEIVNKHFDYKKIKPKKDTTLTLSEAIFCISHVLIDVNVFCGISTFRLYKREEYLERKEILQNKLLTNGKLNKNEQREINDTYHIFQRKKSLAVKTCILFCDIDNYHCDIEERYRYLTPYELWWIIKKENHFVGTSLDVMCVASGHGLQVYLRMEDLYLLGDFNKRLFCELNAAFNSIFQKYGADKACTKDCVRMLRVPETINCKRERKKVEIIHKFKNENHRHTIGEFIDILKKETIKTNLDFESEFTKYYDAKWKEFLGVDIGTGEKNDYEIKKQQEQEIERQCDKENQQINEKECGKDEDFCENTEKEEKNPLNAASGKKGQAVLISNRKHDLYRFCMEHDWNMTGKRNNILFCYAMTLQRSHKDDYNGLSQLVYAMNKNFTQPLDNEEVESICQSASKTDGLISNAKIKDMLGFTSDDMKYMLSSFTQEDKREKARARKQKQRERENKKKPNEKMMQIEAIRSRPELSNQQLMDMLQISAATLWRRRQEMEKLYSEK